MEVEKAVRCLTQPLPSESHGFKKVKCQLESVPAQSALCPQDFVFSDLFSNIFPESQKALYSTT